GRGPKKDLDRPKGDAARESAHGMRAPKHERDGQRVRTRAQPVSVHRDRGPQAAKRQGKREYAVDQPWVTAQPGVEGGHATRVAARTASDVIPRHGLWLILSDESERRRMPDGVPRRVRQTDDGGLTV